MSDLKDQALQRSEDGIVPKSANNGLSNSDILADAKATLERLKVFGEMADMYATTMYAKPFTDSEYLLNDKGERIKDEDGNDKYIQVVNKQDMVACMEIGLAFGLTPVIALAYGKRLNLDAIKKYDRGRKFGLDLSTSINSIYVWGAGDKEMIYTSSNIVQAVLLKNDIAIETIKDGNHQDKIYRSALDGTVFNHKSTKFNDVTAAYIAANNDPEFIEYLKQSKESTGVEPVYLEKTIQVAQIRLTRYNKTLKREVTSDIEYTTDDALRAGLLPGVWNGEKIKGKEVWSLQTPAMLRKSSLMINARLIASDILNGVYIPEELTDVNITSEDIDANKKFGEGLGEETNYTDV